jgi:hypothetical protein
MSMFGVVDDSEISAGTAEPTAEERFRRVQQSQQASGMFGVPPQPGDLPGKVFLQPTSGPSAQEVLGAGLRQSTVVNLLSLLGARQGGPTGDGYSAWDDIKDKPQYWEYASQFAGFRNTQQSHELMARIDQEKKDKDITAASGLSGVITNVLAEAPLMLLPGRVAIAPLSTMPGMYSATAGLRITRAAESALAWGGAGAAQEAILQNAQVTRKPEEAVVGIASATLLGAILGPAVHALRPGLMEGAARDLDRVRAELDAHAEGQPSEAPPAAATAAEAGVAEAVKPPPLEAAAAAEAKPRIAEEPVESVPTMGSAPIAVPAGAAAADMRKLELLTTVGEPGSLRDLTLGTALRGLVKLGFRDLTLRMLQRQSIMAKRAYADVVEIPVLTKETAAGQPASYGGSPVQTQVKSAIRSSEAVFQDKLLDAWTAARFGADKPPKAAVLRSEMGRLGGLPAGAGPMSGITFEDFRKVVGEAANFTKPHDVPQVNEAVQAYRQHRAKWTGRAETSIPGYKNLDQKEGEEHFDHAWNKPLIERERPKFVDHIAEKFQADEVAKQQAQGRMQLYQNSLAAHEAQIAKLTARLEREKDPAKIAEIDSQLQAAHDGVAEMRGKLEEEIGRWEGKSPAEAKSAIKARAKYEAEREAKRTPGEPKGGRLTQADAAVDRAVKHILENERITDDPEAIRARAQQTTDRILGSPDGRLPYEDASAEPQLPGGPKGEMLRGSLAHRLLNVSNEFALPWIKTDIMTVMRRFNRTFIPDVLLAERFGDINMTNNFRQIHEEYNRLIDAARGNASEIAKLTKEKAGAIEDLALARDRLRGVNAISQTASQRRMGQLSTAARNAVVITSMGMSGLNSITDAANHVFMYGMASAFNDGWAPFMKSLMSDQKYNREAKRQAKVAGIATETQTASRHHAMSGIVDHDEPGSPFERALQFGADKMQLLNLLAPETDLIKTISFTIGSTNLYRAAKAALKGTATAKQKMTLGAGNIQPELYEKIVEDYEKHSNIVGGARLPNTEAWREETRQAFEGALHRSADIAATTPGLDLPPEFDTAIGKILLQFKSFTASATTRILIANLQRSDAQTLQGLVTSLALGMVGYKLNSIVTGSPTSDRPQDWFKEAMSRGNIFGWLEEGNTLASKATAGKLDIYRAIGAYKPVSKTAAQSAVEHLLGPTIGKLSDLTKVTGGISSGNFTAGDMHSLRRVTFLQNLWEVNRLFTAVEHGADNAFGIKIPEPKQ